MSSRLWRRTISLALAGAFAAFLPACATPASRARSLPVLEARINHTFTATEDPSRNFPGFIAHGVRKTLKVSVVPGGREILLQIGTPTGCWADAPGFGSEYRRLSDTIPPLRIRLDRRKGRLVQMNAAEVDRARMRTAPQAERLLALCDYDDEEERAEARAEFEKSRDLEVDETKALAFQLHALFLAIRATDGFTRWDRPDEEGPCPEVAGPVLTKLRFKNCVRCKRTMRIADPEDPVVEGDIGAVYITGFFPGPDPSIVSAYVAVNHPEEVRSASAAGGAGGDRLD